MISLRILLLYTMVLFGLSAWGNSCHDADLGWHLFGGAWIVDHGTLPTYDPINFFRQFWHDYHWLAQLVLYGAYSIAELDGLRVLVAITGATIGALLFLIAEKSTDEHSPVTSFIFALIALTLIRPYLVARPQIFSFVVIAYLLYRELREEPKTSAILFFVLALLCINVHVNWIFIPLLWLLGSVIPSFFFREQRINSLIGFLCILSAGFFDPYVFLNADPWITFRLLLNYSSMPAGLSENIGEMRSLLDATRSEALLIYPLFFLGCFSFRKEASTKKELFSMCTFIIGSLILFRFLKFIPLFAIFSLPASCQGFARISSTLSLNRFNISTRLLQFLSWLSLATAFTLSALGSPFFYNSNRNLYAFLPQAPCQRIVEIESARETPLRVLTHFNEGGWCRWFAYQKATTIPLLVSTDGRTQDFDPQLILKSFDLYEGNADASQVLDSWKVDYLLIPNILPLAQIIDQQQWKLELKTVFHSLFVRVERNKKG